MKKVTTSFDYGLNSAAIQFDGENKYLRITDIDDTSNHFKQSKLTSPDTDLRFADDYILREGDILFARTGASVGKTYKYSETDGKVYFAGFLIRARKNDMNDTEFIYQNTLTNRYEKFVRITSQRSGQPGINAGEYTNFDFFIPSITEQRKIGILLKKLDDAIYWIHRS